VDLEVRNDIDYRGHIYAGSGWVESEIIFDTMQQSTLIVGKDAPNQKIPSFFNPLESDTAVKANYEDEDFNDT